MKGVPTSYIFLCVALCLKTVNFFGGATCLYFPGDGNAPDKEYFQECCASIVDPKKSENIYVPSRHSYQFSCSDFSLGQQGIVDRVCEQINNKCFLRENVVVFATCQGSVAPIIGFTDIKNAIERQSGCLSAVVMEGSITSAKSAILRSLQTFFGLLPRWAQWWTSLVPFSSFILPYVGKFRFFNSDLSSPKKKPQYTANNIRSDIPFIIIHSKNDPVTPINGARKLYCALKEQCTNVYLIELDEADHVGLLENNATRGTVKAILKKHNLVEDSHWDASNSTDLQEYQPSTDEIDKRISAESTWRRCVSTCVDIGAGTALVAGAAYFLYKKFTPLKR